ncbi:hypothetical protein NTGBS_150039 [Candidatus Nitrotoga sp. BS]|nr:hypothetical protein NTGBS_150039 [Candidatus Nitrotoga sp. BS]
MLISYSIPGLRLYSTHIVTEAVINLQMVLELVEEHFTTSTPQSKRVESQ